MQNVVLILLSLACCALFIFMAACAYRLISRWLRTPWMLRRLPSGPYHCHYACERDVMADERAASKSPVVNINIGQMALENKGVMANIEKTT